MAGVLGTSTLAQVGFIVRDIETAKKTFAAFLGVEVPPTVDGGPYEVNQAKLRGEPIPESNCNMAFFDVPPGLQIELIQPNGKPSAWQEYLDEYGEGMHHLAFPAKNTDEKVAACEAYGLPCIQRGKYGDGSGEYAYFDAREKLKCFIETLESYPRKDG